jgi:AraC-like DNA-binding protein
MAFGGIRASHLEAAWPTAGGAMSEIAPLLTALGVLGDFAPRLSATRLRHRNFLDVLRTRMEPPPANAKVFAEQMSLSYSEASRQIVALSGTSYLIFTAWTRLCRAIDCSTAGASLSEAARSGGFADTSQFRREMLARIGIEPAEFLGMDAL